MYTSFLPMIALFIQVFLAFTVEYFNKYVFVASWIGFFIFYIMGPLIELLLMHLYRCPHCPHTLLWESQDISARLTFIGRKFHKYCSHCGCQTPTIKFFYGIQCNFATRVIYNFYHQNPSSN